MAVEDFWTPERTRAAVNAVASMEVHQKAHAMYATEEEVANWPEPDGKADCPHCDVTLPQMFRAELDGWYVCSYARVRTA